MELHWNNFPKDGKKTIRRKELPEEIAKKMKSCSVTGCEEWRDLAAATTYHCFPTGEKNQQRWELWTSLLQRSRGDENWIPFRGSLVCSHHFRPQDFVQDPNQKRVKLVKNAIPSIFPTFIVDDLDFVLDDSNDGTNGSAEENGHYENGFDDDDDEEYGYDDRYQHADKKYEHDSIMPEVQIKVQPGYDDDDDEEDQIMHQEPELKYVKYHQPLLKRKSHPQAQMPKIAPKIEMKVFPEEQPAKKKRSLEQTMVAKRPPPPLTFKGAIMPQHQSKGITNITTTGLSMTNGFKKSPQSSNSVASKSKLYEQLCNGPKTKFPLSWNKDIEVELVETNYSGDSQVSSLKQRVIELENENEILKQKFGAQIRALQRKIKDQDKIIAELGPIQINK